MDKLMCPQDSIILDNENTWPNPLIELLNRNQDLIRNYHNRKEAIEIQQIEDVMARVNIPSNIYKEGYEIVLAEVRSTLETYNILGFHCTRLTDYEKKTILNKGLQPLAKNLITDRLDMAYHQKLISEEVYEFLSNNNLSEEYGRTNLVFCFHMIETVKDERGLSRLLTIWGGEAVYKYNYETANIVKELVSIGEPSIVITVIPFERACHNNNLYEKIVDIYLNKDNEEHYCRDIDNRFNYTLKVHEILTIKDSRFEDLTGYSEWDTNFDMY